MHEDDSYASAAAKVLDVRADELGALAADVLDTEDIERLHDMRVATRRLRAALEVFEPCFPRRELKPILEQVKELADALGERRDRDVAIAVLSGFIAELAGPDRPGVQNLIGRLRAEQREANRALAPQVERGRLDALRGRIDALTGSVRAPAEPAGPRAWRGGENGASAGSPAPELGR